MRTFSFSLTNARLARLLTITRKDLTVIRVTDASEPVTISSVTWNPVAALEIGDITETNDGTLSNVTFGVSATTGGAFDPYEIDLGLFEDASILIEITNAANPASKDFEFVGNLNGNVNYDLGGKVQFEALNSFGTPRDIFVRKYTIEDNVDFGDPRRSKIPTFPSIDATTKDLHDVARLETLAVGDRRRIRYAGAGNPSDYSNVYLEVTTGGITGASPPVSPSSTVGSTITDGGVTFTVRNAWARYAQVDTIIDSHHITLTALPDPRASDNTWYAPGRLIMRSGFIVNRVSVIDEWDGVTFELELVEPFGNLLAHNDWLEIAPDYDQTLDMDASKYSNANNYRGFPHLSGARAATSTFVAGSTVPIPPDGSGSGGGAGIGAVEFAAGAT